MSVYFYGCITMDGYLADKNHNLDWLHQSGTVEETSYNDFYKAMDITIMGKKTFDAINQFENPGQFYPSTQNYVFTHQKHLSIDGFQFIEGDIQSFVKQFHKQKNIWIVGGNTLLAPLLDDNLVDVIILQIAPVLLGDGIPLFTQKETLKRYHLSEVKQYGQFAELIYDKNTTK
ncbi:MAG: dihydrofolate reductase family protein [Acholeplasma sp.]